MTSDASTTTIAPANVPNLETLTIASIQSGLAAGDFSAEDLTRACLAQIDACNARYNAIIFVNEAALDTARSIDQRREALGPLAGVPVVIKDPMDTVGFSTTAGWKLLYSKAGGVDLTLTPKPGPGCCD
jgi:amidase